MAACGAYAQGTVNFVNLNTAVTPIIDAHVEYGAGGAMPAGLADSGITVTDPFSQITYGGVAIQVGLYGGPVGTDWRDFVLIAPAVGVGTGSGAGYIISGPDTVRTVAGILPGQPAVFQLRGWDAGLAPGETTPAQTWDEADRLSATRNVYMGKTRVVQVSALGGDGLLPAELIGLVNFDLPWVVAPEPSTFGLGVLALIAFVLLARRRSH